MVNEVKDQSFYNDRVLINKSEKGENVKQHDLKKNIKNKSDYTAISKDGDTLEISNPNDNGKNIELSDKVQPKMSDAMLKTCSKEKLKQLLQNGKITKQQYNKAINSIKS